MAGLTGTGSFQEVLGVLRFFLGLVFTVGWLASALLFWFLIFELLTLRKRKSVEVEVGGVPVPVPCKKGMVCLSVPLLFLAISFVLFLLSYLLMA